MGMIYITSDTHFNHEMLIREKKRPFKSVDEMNELIINNWNKVVCDEDIVYHLGDVALNNKSIFDKDILPRLKGKIIFIRGNHDPINISHIQSIIIEFKTKTFELVHNPADNTGTTDYVLHGHIHKNGFQVKLPEHFYNVNLEYHKYTPKRINDILGELNEKNIR